MKDTIERQLNKPPWKGEKKDRMLQSAGFSGTYLLDSDSDR
jgi:hypothetical protein